MPKEVRYVVVRYVATASLPLGRNADTTAGSRRYFIWVKTP